MKSPGQYTLNEIEVILRLNPTLQNPCIDSALSNIYMLLEQYQKAAATFQVAQEMHPQPVPTRTRQTSFDPAEIDKMPEVLPRRVANQLDRQLLDACVLADE